MGVAVPGAIAAKLVHPHRRVVAVTGDGGFLMNSQELETAMRLETPFVVLVFNDCSYGVIRWKQMQQFGRPAFVDFNNPDLRQICGKLRCHRLSRSDQRTNWPRRCARL